MSCAWACACLGTGNSWMGSLLASPLRNSQRCASIRGHPCGLSDVCFHRPCGSMTGCAARPETQSVCSSRLRWWCWEGLSEVDGWCSFQSRVLCSLAMEQWSAASAFLFASFLIISFTGIVALNKCDVIQTALARLGTRM